MENPFWTYWYYHIPNYVLAALVYSMFARFILGMFVPPDWPNYIWRGFVRLTQPVILVVAFITPSYAHGVFLPIIAAVWLTAIRLGYWLILAQNGLAPGVGFIPA